MKDVQDERMKREKLLKKGLIVSGILLVLLVAAFIGLKMMDSQRSKMLLDSAEIPIEKLTYRAGDQTYINLKEMARYFPSYKYNIGEYSLDGTVTQDTNFFHLKSPYEVIQFKKSSSEVSKYILVQDNYYQFDSKGNRKLTKEEESRGKEEVIAIQEIDKKKRSKEDFLLSSEVLEINNNQFVPMEDIKYIFNVRYIPSGNSVSLYTVEYLERAYASQLTKSNLHLNPNYQNRRAIIDGYFITTSRPTNPIYGIQILENNNIFASHISEVYSDIRYAQNTKTIYVIDNNNQFGLIDVEKTRDIIKAGEYSSIEPYIPEKDLYQVSNAQGKFGIIGVINENTKSVVYTEYDEIGYNTNKFPGETEGRIFFDSLIPVRKDKEWYIFDFNNPGNKPYGKFLDLGYKLPELLEVNSRNTPQFTTEQKEDLTRRGFADLVNEQRNPTEEEARYRLDRLAKEGYVTSSGMIPEGESVLTVPDSTGFGGLVVKYQLSNGQYAYNILASSKEVRDKFSTGFTLQSTYTRIYKLSVDGSIEYNGININGGKFKLQAQPTPQQQTQTETPATQQQTTTQTTQPGTNQQQPGTTTQTQQPSTNQTPLPGTTTQTTQPSTTTQTPLPGTTTQPAQPTVNN